ncbi:hypothetical protein GOBAR_AA32092 [Gossypium barbadense]|uniref:Uncharacterized protein n=1 Tax=Gossypium barbadense TaxID=3634 RepID=A0A2P5WBX0_GOSBA|nr:hypothetical protein GOBAR_AA32092 [Gossypium barbadense]
MDTTLRERDGPQIQRTTNGFEACCSRIPNATTRPSERCKSRNPMLLTELRGMRFAVLTATQLRGRAVFPIQRLTNRLRGTCWFPDQTRTHGLRERYGSPDQQLRAAPESTAVRGPSGYHGARVAGLRRSQSFAIGVRRACRNGASTDFRGVVGFRSPNLRAPEEPCDCRIQRPYRSSESCQFVVTTAYEAPVAWIQWYHGLREARLVPGSTGPENEGFPSLPYLSFPIVLESPPDPY